MAEAVSIILMYVVIPVWLFFGLADWWCHRRTDIQHTSGAKESILHLLMYGEGAIALLAGLFLEINAGVILLFFALLILHEITAAWDLEYANSRREITTLEQHVHSFLEVFPFMALALICVLYWNQFLSIFGIGETPEFVPELKHHPLSAAYIVSVLAAAIVFDFAAYCEELWRCLSAERLSAKRASS